MRERKTNTPATGDEFPDFEAPPTAAPISGVTSILVQWGDEYIQPIQFNGFHVGQLEMQVAVAPGEDPRVVYARTYALLEELAQQQYESKRDGFLKRVKDAAGKVRALAPGKA